MNWLRRELTKVINCNRAAWIATLWHELKQSFMNWRIVQPMLFSGRRGHGVPRTEVWGLGVLGHRPKRVVEDVVANGSSRTSTPTGKINAPRCISSMQRIGYHHGLPCISPHECVHIITPCVHKNPRGSVCFWHFPGQNHICIFAQCD